MKAILYIIFLKLFIVSGSLSANPSIFQVMGKRYGVDPLLLEAIAEQESTKHPWTLNINTHPFFFKSKSETLIFISQVRENPWLLVTRNNGESQRALFRKKNDIKIYINSLEKRIQYTITHLNLEYVDVGIMQINWHYNGKRYTSTIDRLLDVDFNIAASAHLLRTLIEAYGIKEGVGRYHSSTPSRRDKYSAKVLNSYEEKKQVQLVKNHM